MNAEESRIVTLLTTHQLHDQRLVRIEHVLEDEIDTLLVCHRTPDGIVIAKPSQEVAQVDPPNVRTEFLAHLYDVAKDREHETLERREISFWFHSNEDKHLQADIAKVFFNRLLEPESFPKDYANFIKKTLSLFQSFPSILRIDLSLEPTPKTNNDTDDDDDDVVCQSRTRRVLRQHNLRKPVSRRITTTEEDIVPLEDSFIQNFITVLTPAKYDYQCLPEVPVSRKTMVTFSLRAESSAHIALSSVYGDTKDSTYEISIGADHNCSCVIRNGGQGEVMARVGTVDILAQDEFRYFWISWEMGKVALGRGSDRGEDEILSWVVPKALQHSVNCVSVSTDVDSAGEWEFVELIGEMSHRSLFNNQGVFPDPEATAPKRLSARKALIQKALLWHAKRIRMMSILSHAFPASLNTVDLLRLSKINLKDMMTAYTHLKELQRCGWIIEATRGVWMRAPVTKFDAAHELVMCADSIEPEDMRSKPEPTVAIITLVVDEKYAVDIMMGNKTTWLKHRTDGDSRGYIYTCGVIGTHCVVSSKISNKASSSKTSRKRQEAKVTDLLYAFPSIQHILIVGTCGAVPHYTDYRQHVRLGDVILSLPTNTGGAIYHHCEKVIGSPRSFIATSFTSKDRTLENVIRSAKERQDRESFTATRPFERSLSEAVDVLTAEASSFTRPPASSDKLYAILDGDHKTLVEHPTPLGTRENRFFKANRPNVRFGCFGSNKHVACNAELRMNFAKEFSCLAFDDGSLPVMLALQKAGKHSFALIKGAADYADGRSNLDWLPFAAVSAAAMAKDIISALPRNGRR